MSELLNKISSYNFFNYLLPGIVFSELVNKFSSFSFKNNDIIIYLFICYFLGLILSRIGSIMIEPIYKKINIIKYAPYSEYLKAKDKDNGINILMEQNNLYRTLCGIPILLFIFKLYDFFIYKMKGFEQWSWLIINILLLIIFSFAFHKQTKYITNRIRKYKED